LAAAPAFGQQIYQPIPNPLFTLGTTPVAPGTAVTAPTGFTSLGITNGSNSYNLGNGGWYTSSVAYVRPSTTNAPGILDVLADGTATDGNGEAWIDVGTDYTTQAPNGEFIMVRKAHNGPGGILVKGLGSGLGRDLILQDTSFSGVCANGGTCKIGFNASVPSSFQYFARF